MKIGIIGAGNIGRTLGQTWAAAGHDVAYGVRTPDDPKHAALTESGAVVALAAAVAQADVLVLSLPGQAVAQFAADMGDALNGKVVIDATNNVGAPVLNNLDVLAAAARGARLVRAFSTLGWENFAAPTLNGEQIDLFYCGDARARDTADALIGAVGLRPVYVGGVDAAAIVDGMTRLWFTLAFQQSYGRRIAFKLQMER